MLILTSVVNAVVFLSCVTYIGNKIYNKKFKIKDKTNIIVLLIYMIYLMVNGYIKQKVLKIMLTFVMLVGLYKLIYKQNYERSITGSFWVYIIMILAETIAGIVISIISFVTKIDILNIINLENTIYMNVIIVTLMILIFKTFKKKLLIIMESTENCKVQSNIIIYVVLLLTATMTINRIHLTNWKLNYDLITNIIIFLVFLGILLFINKQNDRNMKIKAKYIELAEYARLNDDLLEEYRLKSHEVTNQLAIIKTMYDENSKEINEYLNNLINKNKNHKYNWINEVKYIQLSGLKGLINFKIMEMKALSINLQMNISKEVEKFKFDKFSETEKDDLYSIIGVYLDNAKEAAEKSKTKEVIVEIYLQNDNLIIGIGNTFSGKVDIDKLGDYNYSTKGAMHGVGLYLVKSIIKSNNKFTSTTEIRNKYFFQTLNIKP